MFALPYSTGGILSDVDKAMLGSPAARRHRTVLLFSPTADIYIECRSFVFWPFIHANVTKGCGDHVARHRGSADTRAGHSLNESLGSRTAIKEEFNVEPNVYSFDPRP
jgi:hypothetical protein